MSIGEFRQLGPEEDRGFGFRLAYVRWLRAIGRVEPENDKEFADAMRVKPGWLNKWKTSSRTSNYRNELKKLVAGLAGMAVSESWLIDGEGLPPRPDLWPVFVGSSPPPPPPTVQLPADGRFEHGAPAPRGKKLGADEEAG